MSVVELSDAKWIVFVLGSQANSAPWLNFISGKSRLTLGKMSDSIVIASIEYDFF